MTHLGADDVRALLRLNRDLRERREPGAWWRHLAHSLEELIGARAVLVAEVPPETRPEGHPPLHTHGVAESELGRFLDGARAIHFAPDPLASLRAIYGTRFTAARADLVEDRRWRRSSLACDLLRAAGCDDFLISNAPAPDHGVISSIKVFRAPGDPPFSARDRVLLEIVHDDLSSDWTAGRSGRPRLTPRQRQVLAGLAEGSSEKQIAADLDMSLHTVHDHVKAVYRAFRVHSRGELLARVAAEGARPRTRLVAEAR